MGFEATPITNKGEMKKELPSSAFDSEGLGRLRALLRIGFGGAGAGAGAGAGEEEEAVLKVAVFRFCCGFNASCGGFRS